MKKSVKFAGILAGALTFTSLFGLSAIAEERHRDESSWRESRRGDDRHDRNDRYDRNDRRDGRRDDRDFLTGYVERVDYRRGVVVLRTRNNSRPVIVEMVRRNNNSRGLDLGDVRRGDRVTFVGDWSRGSFTAWRIDDVDSRGGRDRGRW
ncbi:MAG TPA: hypothetical protein VF432_24250 [Thermoanaerobaculia bacterium]